MAVAKLHSLLARARLFWFFKFMLHINCSWSSVLKGKEMTHCNLDLQHVLRFLITMGDHFVKLFM
jgi:hypothetical protein